MLSNEEIEAYLKPMTEDQAASIRAVRELIVELTPYLTEEIDTGKWFGGMLTYYTDDRINVFALGPRTGGFSTFHMLAYYGSSVLQERHAISLRSILSGKSCIKFKSFSQVPNDALRDIISATPRFVEVSREMFAKRRKK